MPGPLRTMRTQMAPAVLVQRNCRLSERRRPRGWKLNFWQAFATAGQSDCLRCQGFDGDPNQPREECNMATYVLVHGACHTGAELEHTAAPIRAAGHEVHTPTIAGNKPGDPKTVGLSDAIKSIVDYLT